MENSSSLVLRQPKENVFLIDWLTVVFHGCYVDEVQRILGLESSKIPWVEKTSFVNGYPKDTFFDNIHIRWGADDPRFYSAGYDKHGRFRSAEEKVRSDMGICLDMSGQGCRAFEDFSYRSWFELLEEIYRYGGRVNITRIDLAYDDHFGLLNIWQIRLDVQERNYISKSKKSRLIWSDDQLKNIIGNTIEIGARSSSVLIRIYDKAAERGFNDRHWIRVELQLREDRANEVAKLLFQRQDVGKVASGILRNYCTFIEPGNDSNKSRAYIADYWSRILDSMEKIRIWIAPGEPYNFSKTMNHVVDQYGQAMVAYYRINHEFGSLLDRCQSRYSGGLSAKYEAAVQEALLMKKQRLEAHRAYLKDLGFSSHDDDWLDQCDMADVIMGLD